MVLNGHDHDYERFAPQTPAGTADPAYGIREFVVGTGGRSLYQFATIKPNSQVRNDDTYGVLFLTLRPSSYSWRFAPIAGSTFTDTGTDGCHARPGTPVLRLAGPARTRLTRAGTFSVGGPLRRHVHREPAGDRRDRAAEGPQPAHEAEALPRGAREAQGEVLEAKPAGGAARARAPQAPHGHDQRGGQGRGRQRGQREAEAPAPPLSYARAAGAPFFRSSRQRSGGRSAGVVVSMKSVSTSMKRCGSSTCGKWPASSKISRRLVGTCSCTE